MVLLGTPENKSASMSRIEKSARFAVACDLFRSGSISQAYRIFLRMGDPSGQPALLANLALCHMKAGEWQRAAEYLEQALVGCKHIPADSEPADDTYTRLAAMEAQEDGYLLPIPEHAPAIAPEYAKTTVRRLLVDCYAALGLWEKVRTLAAALGPVSYGNVGLALREAEKSKG